MIFIREKEENIIRTLVEGFLHKFRLTTLVFFAFTLSLQKKLGFDIFDK